MAQVYVRGRQTQTTNMGPDIHVFAVNIHLKLLVLQVVCQMYVSNVQSLCKQWYALASNFTRVTSRYSPPSSLIKAAAPSGRRYHVQPTADAQFNAVWLYRAHVYCSRPRGSCFVTTHTGSTPSNWIINQYRSIVLRYYLISLPPAKFYMINSSFRIRGVPT